MRVIEILLPHIPIEEKYTHVFYDWHGKDYSIINIERKCIEIIKEANEVLVVEDPNMFFQYYNKYMGRGSCLHNEIILYSLSNISEEYSDKIVEYLYVNFDTNIFDKTSGSSDELYYAKRILRKHSQYCSDDVFRKLETKVLGYISPSAKDRLKDRVEYNKKKSGIRTYSSFWGDFQKDILEILPEKRLSKQSKELIAVLKRKFSSEFSLYKHNYAIGGLIRSPIAGKELSNEQWLSILSNKKLKYRKVPPWTQADSSIVESSIEQFSYSFQHAVSKNPQRMIDLVLKNKENIIEDYIDSLLNGIAYSAELKNVELHLLEATIQTFFDTPTSSRAFDICVIMRTRNTDIWSESVLDILKIIVMNQHNLESVNVDTLHQKVKEIDSFEILQNEAHNSIRGQAAMVIGQLIRHNNDMYSIFKGIIEKLISEANPVIRYASLYALWGAYKVDKEWVFEKAINLYLQDYRLLGFHYANTMILSSYPKYKEQIQNIVLECYRSEDELLVQQSAYIISEMYIREDQFMDVMGNVENMSEKQAESILYMAILYFNDEIKRQLVKDFILRFTNTSMDLSTPISLLFSDEYIDYERDMDFLKKLMKSHLSCGVVHFFTNYLLEEATSIIAYKDIIFDISNNLINILRCNNKYYWRIEPSITRLIIRLYDEASGSSSPENQKVLDGCLDIIDLMFEMNISFVSKISREIMER